MSDLIQSINTAENKKKVSLNLSHYSTILDDNVDFNKLEENILNIFTEEFDTFFSDLYSNEIGLEKEILKSIVKNNDEGLKITGLDGLELEFKFIDLNGIKKIDFNIKISNSNLSNKQEIYLDTIFGYLKEFGFKFEHSNGFEGNLDKKITCENGICAFVKGVGTDLNEIKTDLNEKILTAIISDDFIEIEKLISVVTKKDNILPDLIELTKLKKESFSSDNEELIKEYNNKKLDIIFKIVSKNYRKLIITLDSHIRSIENNIEKRDIVSAKVEGIIEMNSSDELIFLQVKSILEENRIIYSERLQSLSDNLRIEKKKKTILELSLDLGQEIPVIIKQIEKEIPVLRKMSTFFKSKILKNIDNLEEDTDLLEKNKLDNKKKEEQEKKEQFNKIYRVLSSDYDEILEEGRELLQLNYQLLNNNFYIKFYWDDYKYNNHDKSYADKIGHYKYISNYTEINNSIPFIIKNNDLYIIIENEERKVLTIINGDIILGIDEIDEKFSEIIDTDVFKFVKVYDINDKEVRKELFNIKKNTISNSNLSNLTGKYIDIDGERFIQFDSENHKDKYYIGLNKLRTLRIDIGCHSTWITDINKTKFLIINGKKYFNIKIFKSDDNNKIGYRNVSMHFENIEINNNGYINYNGDKDNNIDEVYFDDKISFKGIEYTKFKRGNSEYYIDEKGRVLEEEIEKKLSSEFVTLKDSSFAVTSSNIKEINEKYIILNVMLDDKDYTLYFDGDDFLKEKESNSLFIYLEKIDSNKSLFNGKIIKKTLEIEEVILNRNLEKLRYYGDNIVEIGNNNFEYLGKKYTEVYLEDEINPIFLNIGKYEDKSYYTDTDKFFYKKDGKSFQILNGVNKGNNLELEVLLERGEKSYVTISNEKNIKSVGKNFFKIYFN